MADTITIRITRDLGSIEEIDAATRKLGMTRNQFIIEGIQAMCTWDPKFYKAMTRIAGKHRMSTPFVMQCMLLRRLAEDAAEADIWGPHGKILLEFGQTDEGPLGADELYNRLYQIHHQREGRKCSKMLREKASYGRELTEHEQEILRQHGNKPKPEHDGVIGEDSSTFWEGEPDYKELTGGDGK